MPAVKKISKKKVAKVNLKFVLDCTQVAQDALLQPKNFSEFLQQKIKVRPPLHQAIPPFSTPVFLAGPEQDRQPRRLRQGGDRRQESDRQEHHPSVQEIPQVPCKEVPQA
jgi:hypothetical protein